LTLVAEHFLSLCSRHKDKTALVLLDQRGNVKHEYSYAQLGASAISLAQHLQRSFPTGDRVLLAANQDAEFVISFFGSLLAGLIPVPVPIEAGFVPSEKTRRLHHAVHISAAGALLTSDRSKNLAEKLVSLGGVEDLQISSVSAFLLNTASETIELAGLAQSTKNQPALVQFTSGSESLPKGVLLTNENILSNIELLRRSWSLSPDSRYVNCMPFYHDMGLIGGLLMVLLTGGTCYQLSTVSFLKRPHLWPKLISDHQITVSGAPPFAFERIVNDKHIDGYHDNELDLSTWEIAFCGAQPVALDLGSKVTDKLSRFGFDKAAFVPSYGLAEAVVYAAGKRNDSSAPTNNECDLENQRSGNQFLVAPIVFETSELLAIDLYDTDCDELTKPGDIGEICISGPCLFNGYLPQENKSNTFLYPSNTNSSNNKRRLFRTGDLGCLRKNRLFVIGRLKEVLFSNGEKIPYTSLEIRAAQIDPILNSNAARIVEKRGEDSLSSEVSLQIELHKKTAKISDLDARTLHVKNLLRREFSVDLSQIKYLPPGSLPRTSSGKILKPAMNTSSVDTIKSTGPQ